MTNYIFNRRDTVGRRSRFYRQPSGKRIQLTERDIQLFRLLWQFRFLRSDCIVSHFQPKSPKRLIERLGDLFHETTLINRPAAQWKEAKAEYKPIVYELSNSGIKALHSSGSNALLPDTVVNFGGGPGHTITQFHHGLQISETLFEIANSLSSKVRTSTMDNDVSLDGTAPKSFISESAILKKISSNKSQDLKRVRFETTIPKTPFVPFQKIATTVEIIPDAFFAIEQTDNHQSVYRFYALEVERKNPLKRCTLAKPSTLKKLLAYKALLNARGFERQLTFPNLFVIFATETTTQLLEIVELSQQIWNERERQFLLFAPPERYSDWSSWNTHNTGQVSPLDRRLIMEITQKWSKHFKT